MSPIRTLALPAVVAASLLASSAQATEPTGNPQIDYPGFVDLAEDVFEYREGR